MSTKTPRDKIHGLIKQNYNENTARCVVALVMPVFDALLEEARQEIKGKISIEVQERVDSWNNVIDVDFEEFIKSL